MSFSVINNSKTCTCCGTIIGWVKWGSMGDCDYDSFDDGLYENAENEHYCIECAKKLTCGDCSEIKEDTKELFDLIENDSTLTDEKKQFLKDDFDEFKTYLICQACYETWRNDQFLDVS